MSEFENRQEHLNTWYDDADKGILSEYGSRRLFESIKRTGNFKDKTSIEILHYFLFLSMVKIEESKPLDKKCRRTDFRSG